MRDSYKQISRFTNLSPHPDEGLVVSWKDTGVKKAYGIPRSETKRNETTSFAV